MVLDFGGIDTQEAGSALSRAHKGGMCSGSQLRAAASLVTGAEQLRKQVSWVARAEHTQGKEELARRYGDPTASQQPCKTASSLLQLHGTTSFCFCCISDHQLTHCPSARCRQLPNCFDGACLHNKQCCQAFNYPCVGKKTGCSCTASFSAGTPTATSSVCCVLCAVCLPTC